MKSFFNKHTFGHPIVLGSIAAVVVIAAGSVYYYMSASKPPSSAEIPGSATSTVITATGTVTPSQNPDLAFETGGRVASVGAKVGQSVGKGSLLASLDTSALSASRAQAAANLRAAEAKLAEMKAGPRQVDVSARETAVSQAKQSLQNLYDQVPNDLGAAYSASLGAVHADTDSLFNNPNSNNPSLVFKTSDSQAGVNAASERLALNTSLSSWGSAIAVSDQASLEAALADSVHRLSDVRAYANVLTEALSNVITDSNFPQSSVTTANANLAALRAGISSSLSSLQADSQQIASAKLAIASAQDALNQTLAGDSAQDIEAQEAAVDAAEANLAASDAALRNAIIYAPFSGTVASVQVKVGDIVSPNTIAVSLTPQSALQVETFLSEAEASQIQAGDVASVTLDAYGSSKMFAATVVSVDRSPTVQNGIPAYKATLQFTENDSAISSGMTANVSITPNQ